MMKKPLSFFIFICIILIALTHRCLADDPALYPGILKKDYLTGRFNPSKQELFVPLDKFDIPTNKGHRLLRKEAAEALQRLYIAFHKEHPKAPFWVQSSTRNFDDQRYIWDGKWSGAIEVMGVRLNKTIKDPLKRAVEILKYSSMPGTSRHHWGTDFDLNVLSNVYFEKGEGSVLYRWLEKNAGRFGFCQPYTAGRSRGYSEEKWHWSYMPLSKKFLADWNALYKENPKAFSLNGIFSGSAEAGHLAPLYVNEINKNCE